MPKINSLEVVHQDTNKDSYQNLHDILVELNKSLALGKEVVDGDARASIENLLEMYVNDKEAFLRSLQVLTAEFKESKAQYSQEILLKASELEAMARKITHLTASVATANASIYTESFARATADKALASDITTVSATVGTKNRTFYQSNAPMTTLVAGDLWIDLDDNKLYRWNGTTWINVQDNAIAANTAAITSEATARSTADSALATSIDAVTARLDTGDFAVVKEQAEASVSKNRIYAQTSQPTGGTYVVGDLWIDTDGDNKTYRYNGSSWVLADTSVIKTFSQATAPTAINTGDLWVETDNNNKLWRWNGSAWVDVADGRITQIEAKWGVTTNVNGYVAGIQLLNGGSTSSSFTVDATKFIVKKPNGTNGIVWNGALSRLDISGEVYADAFYGNVIGTTNVNSNSITVPVSSTVSSPLIYGNGAWQDLCSVTVSNGLQSEDIPVIGMFTCRQAYSGGSGTFTFRVVDSPTGNIVFNLGSMTAVQDMPTFQFYVSLPSNTTRTYIVQWLCNTSAMFIESRTLTMLGVKR